MKIKWLIDYFVKLIRFKGQFQKMIQPITDISHNTVASKKIIKNLCNIKVMLKHCALDEISSLMTETIFTLICPPEANSESEK